MIDMKEVNATVETLLVALDAIIQDAAGCSREALALIRQGNRNGAIGAILELDRSVEDAAALYRAALTLHRRAP